jgi:hypothetical protein
MKTITFLCVLLHTCSAWTRFGAKNCLSGCYLNDDKIGIKDQFYCQNGREMGWCCPDDSRHTCRENQEIEMRCSYQQDFYDDLRYFHCIRESSRCGTSQTVFRAVTGAP